MNNSLFFPRQWLATCGWLLGLALLLTTARPALAQIPTATNPLEINPAAPVLVRPDTATIRRKPTKKERRALAAADSAKRTERLFGFRVTRPQKAGFLALAPSGGQIYNKKYWKLPLVYGMVGGLGYWVYFQQIRYIEYRDAYQLGQQPASQGKSPAEYLPNISKYENARKETSFANVYNNLTGYRSYRDLAILVSALGYSLQILDAVVDAHLHDFDVSDNLSLNWQPTLLPVPGQVVPAGGVALTLRVK